jgi:hypothetical protein
MANLKFTPQSHEEAAKVLSFRDSLIIGHTTEGVFATYAGWATSTTTNRLNQLAPARFNIKNREPQINGKTLEDWSEWVKVS